jgi:hypothetical protein
MRSLRSCNTVALTGGEIDNGSIFGHATKNAMAEMLRRERTPGEVYTEGKYSLPVVNWSVNHDSLYFNKVSSISSPSRRGSKSPLPGQKGRSTVNLEIP